MNDKIAELITRAVAQVYNLDKSLLSETSHEQTISARIMYYLQVELGPKWHVDVEYSRQGGYTNFSKRGVKRTENGSAFRPDIIIHQRGTQENLAAIEVKGYWNHHSRIKDKKNLIHMKNHLNYSFICLIELNKEDFSLIREEDFGLQS